MPGGSVMSTIGVLARSGLLKPAGPRSVARLAATLAAWGATPAAGYASAAALTPDRAALIDEAGSLTFREVESRTNALARLLSAEGVDESSQIGILARNHRGFAEATVAAWKLGAGVVFLNTSFAGPQLRDAARGEGISLVIHDAEFAEQVSALPKRRRRMSWEDLEAQLAHTDAGALAPPDQPGRAVILTSGTTGRPRGAQRSAATGIEPAISLLSRIPLRADQTTLIAAPLFHAWGLANWLLALLLRSTVLVRRRFDPEDLLAAIDEHRPTALVAVPVMLERLLELPPRARRRYDTSSLKVVAVSGSALGPDLAIRFMDEFGEVLYNLYGSTEVAWAAIATPKELRHHPQTAGRPPVGPPCASFARTARKRRPGRAARSSSATRW